MKRIALLIVGAFIMTSSFIQAQFTVTNTQTVQDLITNVLAPGVQITNVTVNGAPANVVDPQVGFFDDMGTGFPISSGIVMSTGNAVDCATPNSFSSTDMNGGPDPDLLAINNGTATNDAIVIEFDFLAMNDSAFFNYSFGSEEYNSFINYADIFGFFLSGPGITGPFTNNAINIALVPGTTTEVSISTINNGGGNAGPCMNCQYFNWNTNSPMAFQGYTNSLQAIAAPLQCGQVYHIKMALADNLDGIYDTGVFLEAESFVSSGPSVTLAPINPDGSISTDSTVIEGCTEALLVFTRDDASTDICFPLAVGGTATPGVDYNVLPDSICMAAGQDSVTVAINPTQDGTTEAPESITLGTYIISACGDTIALNGTIWIIDAPTFNVITSDTTLTCPPGNIDISATTDAGTPPFTYDWGAAGNGQTISVPPVTATYNITVTDGCGVTGQGDLDVTINNPAPPTISFNGGATQTICPGQTLPITATITGNTGTVGYEWAYNNQFNPVESTNATLTISPTVDTWVYLRITDNCNTVVDSMRVLMGTVNVTNIIIDNVTQCPPGVSNDGGIQIIVNPAANVGNYTFDLNGGVPVISTSNATGVFTNLTNGGYAITITDVNTGCFLDTVAVVGANQGTPPSWTSFNSTDVSCPGANDGMIEFIGVTGTQANLPFDVIWTPSAGPVINETGVITSTPQDHSIGVLYGAQWVVTIVDALGCASSQIVTINEPDPLNLGLTSNEPLCYGQSNGSVYINATGGTTPYTFTILDADSNQLNQNNSNAAEQIPTGWYYTSLVDANGCYDGDSIFLDQPDSMYASMVLNNPLCYDQPSGDALVDQIFNNQGSVNYSWSPSGDSTEYARFLGAGAHTVTIVDSVGCIWQTSFVLENPDSLYINTISSIPSYCRGNGIFPGSGTVSGTAAGGTGTISYLWNSFDGTTANTNTWGNRVPGWYFLVATDQNGCAVTDSIYVDSLNPISNFTANPTSGTVPINITVTDLSEHRVTNTWQFYGPSVGDTLEYSEVIGLDSLQPAFDSIYTVDGEHAICLIVANDYNCYDTMCVNLDLFPIPETVLPNVFSPNGDGINDTWFPIQEGMASMTCTILNRWGNEVYQINSVDPNDGWNGTNKNTGAQCADGVYTFVYKATAQNGTTFNGNGFIHLIRK